MIELKAYKIEAEQQANAISMSLLGLPEGARLTDGRSSIFAPNENAAIDLEGWNLSKLIMWISPSTPLPEFLKLIVQLRSSLQSNALEIHKKKLKITELTTDTLPALWVTGLPEGAQLTDGYNKLISDGISERHNLLHWNLGFLKLQPREADYSEICLRVEPVGLDRYLLQTLGKLKISLASNNPYLDNKFKYPIGAQQPIEVTLASLELDTKTSLHFSAKSNNETSPLETEQLDDQGLTSLEERLRKILH